MDFNLQQWRDDSHAQDHQTAPKAPGLDLLNPNPHPHHQPPPASSSALPFFVPESATPAAATTKFSFSGMGGSYFSLSQWQELELQALIFRHMTTGDPIPPELLHHVKNSLIASPNYSHYFTQHYYHHYHSPLYLGRAAMDLEPGRCRRTDGKKWRCSRDVVAGQKYCERHMHRGRNRSRKPVELHASTASPYGSAAPKSSHFVASASASASASAAGVASMDFLQFNQRATDVPFKAQKEGAQPSNRMLRHFFSDWPKTIAETETDLSISMPGNLSSDFSLKLGSNNVEDEGDKQAQVNWGMGWESTNPGPAMGGPLAEALQSSTMTTTLSSSSPTSVLHSMPRRRGQASDSS